MQVFAQKQCQPHKLTNRGGQKFIIVIKPLCTCRITLKVVYQSFMHLVTPFTPHAVIIKMYKTVTSDLNCPTS